MRRIQQRSLAHGNCGIACLAMVAGCSYNDALKAHGVARGSETFYTNFAELMAALARLKLGATKRHFVSLRTIQGTAIVKINVTSDGCWHWIVLRAAKRSTYVLDPNPRRKGRIVDFRGIHGAGMYISVGSVRN